MPELTVSLEPLKEIRGFWRSDGDFSSSRVSEISRDGAFIHTSFPARIGTALQLHLDTPGREISTEAVVCRVEPGLGMAVEFQSLTDEAAGRLDYLVQQIELAHTLWVSKTTRLKPRNRGVVMQTKAAAVAPRNRRVERRSRIRHQFTATVALASGHASKPVHAQLTDLGQGGCYVRLAEPFPVGSTLEISIREGSQSFRAHATVASAQPGRGMGLEFAALDPFDADTLQRWLAAAMERLWLASNRRKTHRVLVNLPVHVIARNSVGTEITEETTTISVSPHGALLQLEMHLVKGQRILLRNPSTNDALECSVDYLGVAQDGRREVGVSFVLHNKTLWQIAFPVDWSPEHVKTDRKS